MTIKSLKSSNIFRYILTFFIITILQLLLLVAVAIIPRRAIQDNMIESANYLCQDSVFFYANKKDMSSRIDRYADSIFLNISYNLDSQHPLDSVMSSSYYFDIKENENTNLLYSVTNQTEPTLKYSRYWHGSLIFVRPLLTIFNIQQIYALNAVILFLLVLILIYNMNKHFGKGAAICIALSLTITSIWYVPMSLEYTWMIMLMLIFSIICIHLLQKRFQNFGLFFLVTGSLTAYFDFLTTETLTLLVPMSLIILEKRNQLTYFKEEAIKCIKQALAWCVGYGLTWISKWSLASIILGSNEFSVALSQASYRASGASDNISGLQLRIGALVRNISMLFPFSFAKENSFMLCIVLGIVIFALIYLTRKSGYIMNRLLLIIAFVPYIRYFVLSNHSYMHYFFTFRAQLTTVLCLLLILTYGHDKQLISKELNKLRRKNR